MWGIWSKEEATGGVIPARSCIPKHEETQPDGSEADLNILAQFIIWLLGTPFQCSEWSRPSVKPSQEHKQTRKALFQKHFGFKSIKTIFKSISEQMGVYGH